jgi:hypothetical protein
MYTLWKCLLLCTVLCYINDLVISNNIFKSWKELLSCVLVRCNNISCRKYLTCYQTRKFWQGFHFRNLRIHYQVIDMSQGGKTVGFYLRHLDRHLVPSTDIYC